LFALPDPFHRDRCVECQPDVEAALAAHFGRPIRLRLVVDGRAEASEPPPADDVAVDVDELTDAPPGAVASPLDHVMQAFQGAQVVEE
jgi:hypothetical protein